MTTGEPGPVRLLLPAFLIGSIVTAVAAMIVAAKRAPTHGRAVPAPLPVSIPVAPAEPIAAEAQVFRTTPGMMAIEPEARREREAHPRTLKTFRYLRAYPGAPPRIPHGLTPAEFRTGSCNSCHERGGYSRRFDAYVPVTPHPEQQACLQCHVGDDRVTGRADSAPNARCHLCHGQGGSPSPYVESGLEWLTSSWPPLSVAVRDGPPPAVPHELQGRGNCLPCHAGPAAVAQIRTSHPEWSNCRQCHVTPDPEAIAFTRPGQDSVHGTGGGQ
jgi:nitrate reductase (cytochrome), electron transfer subunit